MLLAVDTSTLWVGLALYDGDRVVGEQMWQSQNHHTIEVVPAIDAMLKRCGITPKDIHALAVALGPGSFTSLRIGLGIVKGMALALHAPVIGVPTLDVLVYSQPVQSLPLAAVLQAGRTRLALAWYHNQNGIWSSENPPQVVTVEEFAAQIKRPTLVCGELNAEQRHLLSRKRKSVLLSSPARSVRRPAFLAEIAWQRLQADQVDDPVSLSPIYLHLVDGTPIAAGPSTAKAEVVSA